jgi:signal peptidase II
MNRNESPGAPGVRIGLALASLAVLAADQASKAAVLSYLVPRGNIQVFPGWFDLTFVANQGALFGLGRDIGRPVRMVIFTLLPLAAIAFILVLMWRSRRQEPWFHLGLALILGGAAGNLIDRMRFGYVIDFLDVYWRSYHWPAFNLADASICVGVGLLSLDLFRERRLPTSAG